MLIRYEVECLDETDYAHRTEKGIVSVKTYGESVDKIYDYYGKDYVISVKIYECDDLLNDEDLKDIVKDN